MDNEQMTDIIKELSKCATDKQRDFMARITPNVDKSTMLGVKTPEIKTIAKEIKNTDIARNFIKTLPHKYFEENQLHAFLISQIKDFDETITEIEKFLPYVDNWATCDQLRPKAFKKNHNRLKNYAVKWTQSDKTYTIRYGIECLMTYYLDDGFSQDDLQTVATIKSDEYYVNMMRAWYFATALSKQYDTTLSLIKSQSLDKFTQNKSIQKARESFRITTEQKEYLNGFKIK